MPLPGLGVLGGELINFQTGRNERRVRGDGRETFQMNLPTEVPKPME